MELVNLFQGELGRSRSWEGFGYALPSDLSMQAQLWMAFAVRLSAMASLLATTPSNDSNTARAKITQAEKLAQQVGALGLQIRNGQSHRGLLF